MRFMLRLFVLLVLLSPVMLAGLAWLALADAPEQAAGPVLGHRDVARAQALLRRHDPRHLEEGATRSLEVSAADIELVAAYVLRRLGQGGVDVSIDHDTLDMIASLRVPRLPVRPWVNVALQMAVREGRPRIAALRVGAVPVPPVLAEALVPAFYGRFYPAGAQRLAADAIQEVSLSPGRLRVAYAWRADLLARARNVGLQATDRAAMRAYLDRLVSLQDRGIGKGGSLVDLLQPLFAYARERSLAAPGSGAGSGDALVENQALLAVLGAWAAKHGLDQLVPDAPRPPARFRVRLERRMDFAQHFLTSAALAARGDSRLSDAVGLFKEMQDAESGSGFSFTDIAADRAGTRFGRAAVDSAQSARRLQAFMGAGVVETDIMPRARDLPEHMNAREFRERFGRVGSPAYEGVMAEIEARIDRCRLHRLDQES